MMQLGARGLALIESFEKLALAAYQDQGGIWTIGYGHVGPDAFDGATCSVDRAVGWLTQDTQKAALAVLRSVDVPLTQNQFDAVVAFTFNVGVGAEAHSTLCRLLNTKDFAAAADEFPRWNHVAGVVSDGLTRRRAAERELFLSA